jgi:60S ribosomal subunit assembly/export protein LOC1
MAPNRGSSTAGHKGPKKSGNKGSSSKASKGGTLKPKSDSKSRVSKKGPKAPPPKQQKTRPGQVVKKKKRVYTDKELGLPQLNMITPVGVQKPKGKKKGKVFVDDAVRYSHFVTMDRLS